MSSGADLYSGWITAFTFWNKDRQGSEQRLTEQWPGSANVDRLPPLTLDSVPYPRI